MFENFFSRIASSIRSFFGVGSSDSEVKSQNEEIDEFVSDVSEVDASEVDITEVDTTEIDATEPRDEWGTAWDHWSSAPEKNYEDWDSEEGEPKPSEEDDWSVPPEVFNEDEFFGDVPPDSLPDVSDNLDNHRIGRFRGLFSDLDDVSEYLSGWGIGQPWVHIVETDNGYEVWVEDKTGETK